jgi:precorrin-2 dehydrogenase/sirohydrochlorin ferrochelatase
MKDPENLKSMPYYPILVDLQGKDVLVIGGGTVAQRKIETLLEYGAVVKLISRQLTPTLNRYLEKGKIKFLDEEFRENYLDGIFMVVASTDDASLNHRISQEASKKGLLINAVDQPSDCNFIVPAILRRGDLLIAVSTSGKSPALAKKVRVDLEDQFGLEYGTLLVIMGNLRKEILSRGLSQDENSRIFHDIVDSHILEAIRREDWDEVASILTEKIPFQLSSDDVVNYIKG